MFTTIALIVVGTILISYFSAVGYKKAYEELLEEVLEEQLKLETRLAEIEAEQARKAAQVVADTRTEAQKIADRQYSKL